MNGRRCMREEQREMSTEVSTHKSSNNQTNRIAKEASPNESEIHPSHKPYGSYSVYFAPRGGAVWRLRHRNMEVMTYKKGKLYKT